MNKLLVALMTAMVCGTAVSQAPLRVERVVPAEAQHGSRITLSNGTKVVVPLVRVEPIAVLKTPLGNPQILLSGAGCTECDENQSIYLIPLNYTKGALPRYSYPGTLKTYDTDELAQKAQVFFGQCIENGKDAVVWFLSYLGKDGKWHESNTVLLPNDEGKKLAELSPTQANLGSVVQRTTSGLCKEIPGTDGTTEP